LSLALSFAALAAALIPSAVLAQEPVFNLTIKDHKFDPAELVIPVDTKVKLVVKNMDATPEEFDSKDLRREKVIPGGQEAIVYVGPLKAGTYKFMGEFNPSTAQGRIVVK
jgi:hypothetical protein